MSLAINGRVVAKAELKQAVLLAQLGAYELCLIFSASATPMSDTARWLSIDGAHVKVRGRNGEQLAVGYARPHGPLKIRQQQGGASLNYALSLSLAPSQLARLEELRDGADLDFELAFLGEGGVCGDDTQNGSLAETLWLHTPQSEWVRQLGECGFVDILLMEVPLPALGGSRAVQRLQTARKHFIAGDYTACVAECRQVVDEIGFAPATNKSWHTPALDGLRDRRGSMTKGEREIVILAAVKHYTQLAHHTESEGGVATYSRDEAFHCLALTSSCALFSLK